VEKSMMMANRLKNLAENTCNINGLKINFRLVTATEKKRVHWADSVQVFKLEEHEGGEELYQDEPDKEKEERIHNDNNRSINCKTRVSPSCLDPATVEEFSPPFLYRLVKDNASIGPECDFEVPFPSRSTLKFEPENLEEAFSAPFPT
jgi:hypothetical protein